MKKVLLIGLLVLMAVAAVLCAAGIWFWQSMGRPLYAPGMVRDGVNLRAPLDPPEQPVDPSAWQVEPDIRLAYEAVGTGRPVLVLHGGPGFPYDKPWAGLDAPTDRYTFYYYHQRGCGDSTRPFDRFTSRNYYGNMTELEQALGIGAQVADVQRIRRILGEEKLILVGHSFGGFLAAMYAAEFPEHVDALILVAPAGVLVLPNEETDIMQNIADRLPENQRQAFEQISEEYLDFGGVFAKSESELASINRAFGGFLLAAMGEPLQELDEAPPTNGGWMVQAMYFSMGSRHDYRQALSDVRCPVLVIQGQDDDLTLAGSRTYADCFPNARLHMLAPSAEGGRAGHFVFNDQPAEFANVIEQFLATSVP